MNKKIIIAFIIVLVLVAGYFLFEKECVDWNPVRSGGVDRPYDPVVPSRICKFKFEKFLENLKPGASETPETQ